MRDKIGKCGYTHSVVVTVFFTYVHMACIDVVFSEVTKWVQDHTIVIIWSSYTIQRYLIGVKLTRRNIGKTVLFLIPLCPCCSNCLSFTITQCLQTHTANLEMQ